MTADVPEVLRSVGDGVATLTLNRPDRLNAWTPTMADLYRRLLDDADADDAVRVVVVTGAGKGFCAGGDLGLKATGHETDTSLPEPYVGVLRPRRIRKPVIAAINGACAGAGFTLALACDVRFAAEGAKLSSSFVRRGRVGTPGLAWLLVRMIGSAAATELLLSGRVLLAEEAQRLGIVTAVRPRDALVEDVLAYARDLAANCAPRSMAEIKRQIHAALDQDFESAVADGAATMTEARTWPEAAEGTASYMERRPPRFPPLPKGDR
ncbi:MAG: enoyl-CoA hydratase/isomerase family protein [Chloroflexota bacterium]|nr:enoyl-CoA hydratase/isomerase family protein [Chloroflexota bacterium]MDE3103198.1 enoyl-CoA hydratase/isomerase family protein [Chloroflexota bacterium]